MPVCCSRVANYGFTTTLPVAARRANRRSADARDLLAGLDGAAFAGNTVAGRDFDAAEPADFPARSSR